MKNRLNEGRNRSMSKPSITAALLAGAFSLPLLADEPSENQTIERWLDDRFSESTLNRAEQRQEMEWFREAAKPFQDMEITVLSEDIATHRYESEVLAKAFSEITGIQVRHDVQPEGDVIEQFRLQMMMSAKGRYDAFITDSDLIGTHSRSGWILALDEFMEGAGRDVTLPTLDLEDFIGLDFVTGPDGHLYQLPDQQFANLYWFRADWFERPDLRRRFEERYGYELGVPVNWSAYEDIAEFFTVHVQEIDGERVYGHMDYASEDPSLGWRFTDAWFSMAGAGDKGLPNGLPVDEWGIRMEECRPVGSSMARGGATNSPAAVYSLETYLDWLDRFAPPEARDMNFTEAGPVPGQGHIAQQIFWYTAFTSDMIRPDLPVMNDDGTPKWRMAPSPHGAYWEEGMKLGYQDAGSWTIPRLLSEDRQKAAWLYAQFAVSKTVSLAKTLAALTPIRESDIQSEAMTEAAPRLGGLVEFYRSPARKQWTPTGVNVPNYPKLARLWWPRIADAVSGESSPQEALDSLAEAQDRALSTMQRTYELDTCGPHMVEKDKVRGADYWLAQPGAPKPALSNEKPPGQTITYNELLKQWGVE